MGWHDDGMTPTQVPPLVLITGDEMLLVDRAIWRATAAARRIDPGVERRDATAAGLAAGEFWDLVAPSLFAEPRLVVIRGAQDAAKDLAAAVTAYCADPVEGVTLLVHHTGGARNKALADALTRAGATVVVCNKITKASERVDFVRSEIRRAGGTTSPDAVAALVDAVGSDLRELASAAGQLVADTGGMVDEKAVRRYHRGRADVTGFTVSDAAMAGDLPAALESLRWAVGVGVAPVLIADALADGVRTVAKVSGARGGNSYALASQLGHAAVEGGQGARHCSRLVVGRSGGRDGGGGRAERGGQGIGGRPGVRVGAGGDRPGRRSTPALTADPPTDSSRKRQMPSRRLRRLSIGADSPIASRPEANRWDQRELTSWANADLRFAAWFGWMTPLETALSRLRDAATSSTWAVALSPDSAALRTRRTDVFSADLTDLLRRRAASLVRMRLIWDLILATPDCLHFVRGINLAMRAPNPAHTIFEVTSWGESPPNPRWCDARGAGSGRAQLQVRAVESGCPSVSSASIAHPMTPEFAGKAM